MIHPSMMCQATRSGLEALVARLRPAEVLVVGDVMVDCDLAGTVERLAPEAPIPILRVGSERWSPGGAAHVAALCAQLGARVEILGRAGDDPAGEWLVQWLVARGIGWLGLRQDADYQTPRKVRGWSASGGSARPQRLLFRYDLGESGSGALAAEEELAAVRQRSVRVGRPDAVLVCDHGRGIVSGEMMDTLRSCGAPVLVDPALGRSWSDYGPVTLVKCNQREARACPPDANQPHAVTSENGVLRLVCGGKVRHFQASSVRRTSGRRTIGAGDQVLAALGVAIASGLELEEACQLAMAAAAEYVAGSDVVLTRPVPIEECA